MFIGVTPTILRPSLVAVLLPAVTTWDPNFAPRGSSFSDDYLTASSTAQGQNSFRGTTAKNAGKLYFELTSQAGTIGAGVTAGGDPNIYPGVNADSIGYFRGTIYDKGTEQSAGLPEVTASNTVGVHVDFGRRLVFFSYNGNWGSAGGPDNGGSGYTLPPGPIYPACIAGSARTTSCKGNFGQSAFLYTPALGYQYWG